jgi:serine/threonine-protein kinase
MDIYQRYEIVGTLGQGDFAIVYKARDLELRREVAIKQIHPQYLTDRKQLERYWYEAQLLASLEHPNIMTIYDIQRSHGWLVLELMQGNLRDTLAGQPMNLDALRVALFHCLHALKFLHANGVIHGDIKPSNLMIDRRNRVKLGDFGLARRVANEEGSLLKGTTKYMAPEVFSDQFGPVTPASDLYSLGFTAYELLCGARFEDLFPGLNAFGRDRQIAWMMWHAAPDRKLPEISRVLEGVPPDLQRVVEKLTIKDPQQRYGSADEALADLAPGAAHAPRPSGDDEPSQEALAARKRKRMLASMALVCSAVLSAAMLLWGGGTSPPPPDDNRSYRGVLRTLEVSEKLIVLDAGRDTRPPELTLNGDVEVRLNDRLVSLRDLQLGDELLVQRSMRDGKPYWLVIASRPVASTGRIQQFQAALGRFVLEIDQGPERGAQLALEFAGEPSAVWLNGQPATLEELRDGDEVEVQHTMRDQRRVATSIRARRLITLTSGAQRDVLSEVIRKTDDQLVLRIDRAAGQRVEWPVDPNCLVTINGRTRLDGIPVTVLQLRSGDEILELQHHTHVVRVDVYRTFIDRGTIRDIQPETRTISLSPTQGSTSLTVQVPPDCAVQLGGESVTLSDLHRNDQVEVLHESPDRQSITALRISATRPFNPTRFALLIALDSYDDQQLPPLPAVGHDARAVHRALVARYQVPEQNATLLVNESRVRLRQEIADFLAKASMAQQLLVYVTGHAFVDDSDTVHLAPRDYDSAAPAATGLPLAWLIQEIDACAAREKLIFLDTCHAVPARLEARQPSSAEQYGRYRAASTTGGPKGVTVIASCTERQRAVVVPGDPPRSVFGLRVEEALKGGADKNRDNLVNSSELFEYLQSAMSAPVGLARQTPVLFVPAFKPPRLSEEARQAIRDLLALSGASELDADRAAAQYRRAADLAGNEPEARLAYGLVLLHGNRLDEALTVLDELKVARPDLVLPHEAVCWIHFRKRNYTAAISALTDLVKAVPRSEQPGTPLDPATEALWQWCGRLREFGSEQVAALQARWTAVDEAINAAGPSAVIAYNQGRAAVRKIQQEFDARLAKTSDQAERIKIGLERRQVTNFASFTKDDSLARVLARLDK